MSIAAGKTGETGDLRLHSDNPASDTDVFSFEFGKKVLYSNGAGIHNIPNTPGDPSYGGADP